MSLQLAKRKSAILWAFFMAGCHKTNDNSCGCSAREISSVQNVRGTLMIDQTTTKLKINFGGERDFGVDYIICDTGVADLKRFLPSELNQSIDILFSGSVKESCEDSQYVYITSRKNVSIINIKRP